MPSGWDLITQSKLGGGERKTGLCWQRWWLLAGFYFDLIQHFHFSLVFWLCDSYCMWVHFMLHWRVPQNAIKSVRLGGRDERSGEEGGEGEGRGGSSVTLLFRSSCGTAVQGLQSTSCWAGCSMNPCGSCFWCEQPPGETEMGLPYTKLKYLGWGVKCHSNSAEKTLWEFREGRGDSWWGVRGDGGQKGWGKVFWKRQYLALGLEGWWGWLCREGRKSILGGRCFLSLGRVWEARACMLNSNSSGWTRRLTEGKNGGVKWSLWTGSWEAQMPVWDAFRCSGEESWI